MKRIASFGIVFVGALFLSGCSGQLSSESFETQPAKNPQSKVETQTQLIDTVSSTINEKTRGAWNKKVDITTIDYSQKIAEGKYGVSSNGGFPSEESWIAWQINGKWNVAVSLDGFVCDDLKTMPKITENLSKEINQLITNCKG